LTHVGPGPDVVAKTRTPTLEGLGILESRAKSIVALARSVSGGLQLEPGGDPESTGDRLTSIAGIGEWTASYIAMRALRAPDAFLPGDVVIRKALGGATQSEALRLSEPWRPFRSYATMHLWKNAI
jgi:AraC family transcriptional regulator of adaptative response / DNA-3-methyladenine glycosylase II